MKNIKSISNTVSIGTYCRDGTIEYERRFGGN